MSMTLRRTLLSIATAASLYGEASAQYVPQFDIPGAGDFGPIYNCGDEWISYDRETASPGEYFSVSAEKCNFVPSTGVTWSVFPPLPEGMLINRSTGRIYGQPPVNTEDHQVRYTDALGYRRTAYPFSVRTVTAEWTGITGSPMSATAIFKYDFVDPAPLVTQSYTPIRFSEGDGRQYRYPRVSGGTGPYTYELLSTLPEGYGMNRYGLIYGEPDDPYANCVDGCREWVRVTDALGRTDDLYALVSNETQYKQADDVCYVLIHGQGPKKTNYADQIGAAKSYWSKNRQGSFYADLTDRTSQAGALDPSAPGFVDTLTANGDRVYFVGYNSHDDIRQSALTAASQIASAISSVDHLPDVTYESVIGGDGCRGAEKIVLVGHSMGGMVIDYILGNADANRRNYANIFKQVTNSVDQAITVQTPHRGSEVANAKCDWTFDPIVYIFSGECDDGSWDLQTSEEMKTKIGPLARPTWAIGSHQGMCTEKAGFEFCSNDSLDEQNDGAVEYTSAFACTGENPNDDEDEGFGQTSTHVCSNSQKVISGLFNFDASDENHDSGRNGQHPRARRYFNIPDSLWSGLPQHLRPASSDNFTTAEAISHVFGDAAWLHLN